MIVIASSYYYFVHISFASKFPIDGYFLSVVVIKNLYLCGGRAITGKGSAGAAKQCIFYSSTQQANPL